MLCRMLQKRQRNRRENYVLPEGGYRFEVMYMRKYALKCHLMQAVGVIRWSMTRE